MVMMMMNDNNNNENRDDGSLQGGGAVPPPPAAAPPAARDDHALDGAAPAATPAAAEATTAPPTPADDGLGSEDPDGESMQAETFDVNYSCLRCGTKVSGTELNRLPEIKCICGFRVFTKVRPQVVKSVRAI